MKTELKEDVQFDVIGAGKIQIGKSKNAKCGGVKGFSFDCEWGKYGMGGGVISREDAKDLAEHILLALKNKY